MRHLSILCGLFAAATTLSAQSPLDAPIPDATPRVMPGRRAGTERWIAQFATRSFDLATFRDAIYARRPAAEVDAIVADMQRRVRLDQAAFVAAVESLGGEVIEQFWLVNAAAFEIDPTKLDAIRALPDVTTVDPSLIVQPAIITATNAANHDSDAVNAAGNSGLGVCAAVMDTGQDESMAGTGRPHRFYFVDGDPANTTGGGLGGSRLVVNRQIGTATADDPNSHGTGVASIVASGGWLSANQDRGHAPRAQVAGYAIGNNAGGGSDFATIARAWQTIAADRARYNIVAANNSYSGSNSAVDVSQQALDSCAYNADVMVCCAAANGGASTASSQSVANGLAVAAVNADSHTVANFSSRGPLASDPGRFYPDLAACGVNTVMAARDNESGNYTGSGTSMASPQVCGAATLVRNVSPVITADQTKAILLVSARDISAQNPVAPYNTRNAYGMGLLRDDSAVAIAADPDRYGRFFVETSATTYSRRMAVTSGQPYQVALTWHRTNFAVTTWANLELQIYNGATLLAQSNTTRNLYEMVRFTPTFTGTVEIRVVATSFETGTTRQWFAWAASADTTSNAPGAFALYGTGCGGTIGSGGLPAVGAPLLVTLSGALNNTPSLLLLGASNTTWGALTLPASLAAAGASGCFVNAAGTVQIATNTTGAGSAALELVVPNNLALNGATLYLQWAHRNAAANSLGFLFTRGAAATIGLP
jgi:hypothetical protein